jgi:hypothetical protein
MKYLRAVTHPSGALPSSVQNSAAMMAVVYAMAMNRISNISYVHTRGWRSSACYALMVFPAAHRGARPLHDTR